MNAYLLGKENMDFGKQVINGKNAQQQGENQNNIEDGKGFAMSNPDDKSPISSSPDLLDLSHMPDEGSTPDGAAAAPEFDDTHLNEEAKQAQLEAQSVADRRARSRAPESKGPHSSGTR
jgi:hypothetical protein